MSVCVRGDAVRSNTAPKLLRIPEVQRRTGLSRSHIYALEASGQFPSHCKIAKRVSAWSDLEVTRWVEERLAERPTGRRQCP